MLGTWHAKFRDRPRPWLFVRPRGYRAPEISVLRAFFFYHPLAEYLFSLKKKKKKKKKERKKKGEERREGERERGEYRWDENDVKTPRSTCSSEARVYFTCPGTNLANVQLDVDHSRFPSCYQIEHAKTDLKEGRPMGCPFSALPRWFPLAAPEVLDVGGKKSSPSLKWCLFALLGVTRHTPRSPSSA